MPYIFDEALTEWLEDDGEYEPPAPKPKEFAYFPPGDIGGARAPVTFADPTVGGDASGGDVLGKPRSAPGSCEDYTHELLAIMLPELRDLGVVSLRCRYDGGYDEGFAWLHEATLADGTTLDPDALAARLLADPGTKQRLDSAKIQAFENRTPTQKKLAFAIANDLCLDWAVALLGRGYGTGEFAMYGMFTVDLRTNTITDDETVEPFGRNIAIDTSDREPC